MDAVTVQILAKFVGLSVVMHKGHETEHCGSFEPGS